MSSLEQVVDERGPKFQVSGPDPGFNVKVAWGQGQLAAQKLPVRQLVAILSGLVEVPLVDKTGLTGVFDVKLVWAPDTGSAEPSPGAAAGSGSPDIRTALREQLGLKLIPAKLPVEVLVVDTVAKPDEN
jgi:uncharacterized protein (TIGR03435 family)